ncbi:hypothetical protein O0I10_000961 [Lichtheimia ornata]|uniref:BZIP domain-containing protein n=1 Tax=Lichtheimia ornata TaxID=688661 RepID=A0AAD7Y4M1_9FUNG|nr:uncharacterized protein O0I10_000961 [Lichtheimia ornata]KAJ8663712.1 hypothetical protein O0I10_000961 [Lichtheimia ornata]
MRSDVQWKPLPALNTKWITPSSLSSHSMVSLLYDIKDWKHQQTIPHSIMIPSANNTTTTSRWSLLHQQQQQQQQQQQPNTSMDDATLASPISISYDSESYISLSDDEESDDEMLLLPLSSSSSLTKCDDNGCGGSLRFYGQRLGGAGAIQKRRTSRNARLQEAHRFEMLKRRLCELETRNQRLKVKEMTLEEQRDAVAAKEYEDRQRVLQLEEQLKALKESLLTCAYTDK